VPGDVLGEAALARARAGDEDAFRELTDPYRRELQVHLYRILGSVQDSEDLVQETLLAAWRGLEAFEGRSSVRAWLYRIATNRCLNALRDRARRPRKVQAMVEPPEPTRRTEPIWLEPYPDVLLEDVPDRSPGPEARYEAREAVELAFISALQNLPPRQRGALVLRDVLGFRTAEVADTLDTGEASVKGALQRARATLGGRLPAPDRDRAPLPNSAFLRHRADLRGAALRVVPTRANSQPALSCYLPDPHAAIARPYGMIVVTLAGDAIAAITWFSDTGVFRHFGLPRTLPNLWYPAR
jgi:RNA polymerase sigma factor (sigma-70 family)